MCSRLTVKLSTGTREARPGDQIPFRPAGSDQVELSTWGIQYSGWSAKHSGPRLCTCARVETFRQKWLSKGWSTGTVPVQNFAEGYGEQVRQASIIDRPTDLAALHRDGQVALLTREATEEERAFLKHHRVPVECKNGKLVFPNGEMPGWVG